MLISKVLWSLQNQVLLQTELFVFQSCFIQVQEEGFKLKELLPWQFYLVFFTLFLLGSSSLFSSFILKINREKIEQMILFLMKNQANIFMISILNFNYNLQQINIDLREENKKEFEQQLIEKTILLLLKKNMNRKFDEKQSEILILQQDENSKNIQNKYIHSSIRIITIYKYLSLKIPIFFQLRGYIIKEQGYFLFLFKSYYVYGFNNQISSSQGEGIITFGLEAPTYKSNKRDGGIMNYFMDGNDLVTNQGKILKNCLFQLGIF
ncbi:unnamed protein product [Paramecium sonneborni]|uniref:Transmembrane protein n=1 Tax=Paramecium sonneborni TaxID=65129 RepID=A0A8S1R1K1_9CILI|nr:unnamed protein product [Paramecium sonneborni]